MAEFVDLEPGTVEGVGHRLVQRRGVLLDVARANYRRLAWADSSDALAALRVVSDSAGGDEQATILAWRHASAANAAATEISAKTAGVTGGLVVSSDRALQWADGQKMIYFGLREPRPPRETNAGPPFNGTTTQGVAPGAGNTGQIAAAPQTGPDVPSLILWHWKDPRMQSQQQVQEAQDKAFSYQAVYHVAQGKVVQLTDARMRDVSIGPKDTWAVGTDIADYERDAGIKGFVFRDVYAVNVATGERKLMQKKVPGNGGGGGRGGGASPAFAPGWRSRARRRMRRRSIG